MHDIHLTLKLPNVVSYCFKSPLCRKGKSWITDVITWVFSAYITIHNENIISKFHGIPWPPVTRFRLSSDGCYCPSRWSLTFFFFLHSAQLRVTCSLWWPSALPVMLSTSISRYDRLRSYILLCQGHFVRCHQDSTLRKFVDYKLEIRMVYMYRLV